MGLDLKLLPIPVMATYSHDVITLERRRDLFKKIEKIEEEKGEKVPKGFNTYLCREEVKDEKGEVVFEGTHYGETLTTPYGNHLQYICAKDLLLLSEHEDVKDNWTNKAVWAYLENIPPDIWVALMWD